MDRIESTGRFAKTLRVTLAVALILIGSIRAYAFPKCDVTGDYPFSVLKDYGTNGHFSCLICNGPFGRSSDFIVVSDLSDGTKCNFYAADNNFFTPRGKWHCEVHQEVSAPQFCTTLNDVEASLDFCLTLGTVTINLDLKANNGVPDELTSDQESPPCKYSGLRSFLGDNPDSSASDTDVYKFNGKAGDNVTISLDPETKGGNLGGQATLKFTGKSVHLVKRGALPLEITTTLPAAGEYTISVEQPHKQAFRGFYELGVQSNANSEVDALLPTRSVEK